MNLIDEIETETVIALEEKLLKHQIHIIKLRNKKYTIQKYKLNISVIENICTLQFNKSKICLYKQYNGYFIWNCYQYDDPNQFDIDKITEDIIPMIDIKNILSENEIKSFCESKKFHKTDVMLLSSVLDA